MRKARAVKVVVGAGLHVASRMRGTYFQGIGNSEVALLLTAPAVTEHFVTPSWAPAAK